MTIPQISPLPSPPNRGQPPAEFSEKTNNFLGSLPNLVVQVNQATSTINSEMTRLDAVAQQVNLDELVAVKNETRVYLNETIAARDASLLAASETGALVIAQALVVLKRQKMNFFGLNLQ